MQLKRLPIGISTFNKIIEGNYIYIDKTKEALDLITNHSYIFLSRPRRFGKSLFLDTLQEIFKGNKKLFKGLYIYDKWNWQESYPVIKISFSGNRDTIELKNSIIDNLRDAQQRLGMECYDDEDYAIYFSNVIKRAYEKYRKRVVILIDEYDKPILDNLDQIEVAKECREILKRLYTQIKNKDRYIKFAFLTGVSKFSKASIFSGLNNLRDISLLPQFGTICGYTQKDIESSFLPYLNGVDLDRLKEWYNGYNFLSDKVYNPFDILLFIDGGLKYKNYWFNTGTPNFLIKLFRQNRYNLAKFENLKVSEMIINAFDIEQINLETVMFQAGYLTIKEEIERRTKTEYILTYPNYETKVSFNDYLADYFSTNSQYKYEIQSSLIDIMELGEVEKLESILKALFASIAYNNFTANSIQDYEGFYASVVYAYFAGAGFDKIIAEDVTNDGRMDLSVFIDNKVYIFEFKVNKSGALEQIKEKGYHTKYIQSYIEIYIIGVEFNSKKRNLVKYEWERVL